MNTRSVLRQLQNTDNRAPGFDRGTQFGLLAYVNAMTLLRMSHLIPTVSARRLGRMSGVVAASVASMPLSAYQSLSFGRRIRQQPIEFPPVFIIGHWRSGTTHLHNLLSQDPQFGCLRMFEAIAPGCSLATGNWLAKVMQRVMPSKRPMDNMAWPMDAPQEEEIALSKVTPYAWYLQFLFPQQALQTFRRYVLLQDAPRGARAEVKTQLLRLMKIATINESGKRLLLKNPVNTARISMLLEMFPDARFIFLHRSPYDTFPSTKKLHRKILGLTSMQRYNEQTIEQNTLSIYPALIQRYLKERELIRPNRLIEVAYSELEQNPLEVCERIYGHLELPGFHWAHQPINDYVASLGNYRKNQFPPLTGREINLVNTNWGDGFSEWGYRPINPSDPYSLAAKAR